MDVNKRAEEMLVEGRWIARAMVPDGNPSIDVQNAAAVGMLSMRCALQENEIAVLKARLAEAEAEVGRIAEFAVGGGKGI
jgi:hypothetical protein